MKAADRSLRWGMAGLGSFDETGAFRNVKIKGEPWKDGAVGGRSSSMSPLSL